MNRYEALKHAVIAHAGQTDKCDKAYILHPIAVASAFERRDPVLLEHLRGESAIEILVSVALLHDVYEDAPPHLRPSEREINDPYQWFALAAITRDTREPYERYLARVCDNDIAARVKLADLWHNLSPERQACLPEKERASLEARYLQARDRIWDALGYEWWPDDPQGPAEP